MRPWYLGFAGLCRVVYASPENHPYCARVLGEMAIGSRMWCDFNFCFVYQQKGLFSESPPCQLLRKNTYWWAFAQFDICQCPLKSTKCLQTPLLLGYHSTRVLENIFFHVCEPQNTAISLQTWSLVLDWQMFPSSPPLHAEGFRSTSFLRGSLDDVHNHQRNSSLHTSHHNSWEVL